MHKKERFQLTLIDSVVSLIPDTACAKKIKLERDGERERANRSNLLCPG